MATPTIKINQKVKGNFRQGSARAQYYAMVVKYNGKTVKQLATACKAKPPSVPKVGKLKGKQEPLNGWLSYFVRNGYISIS